MDQFRQELAQLVSLLSDATNKQAPSTTVSRSTFSELQQFFRVLEPAPKEIKQTPLSIRQSVPQKQMNIPEKPPIIQKPTPPQTPQLAIKPEPAPQEPELAQVSERNKKQERLLPMPCAITPSDISKTLKELPNHLFSNKNLFQNIAKSHRWGYFSYLTDNKELATFIESISLAITSKLSIPLSFFDKNDEQLALRLRAASSELSLLLVFGEPHSESSIKKQLLKLHGFTEQSLPSYPLIHFLGNLNQMRCYFVPLATEMKEDVQAKKKLWISLQTLAKTHEIPILNEKLEFAKVNTCSLNAAKQPIV